MVGSNSMRIPCLARVSYGVSVSGFQGWQGRRRDSPMRQRKLIGSTIDETDLRGGKIIILGTTHAPLKLPSTTAAFDRLV